MSTTEAARTFRAHPSALRHVRDFVREQAGASGLNSLADDLVLATSEAAGNAIVHSATDRIDVAWHVDDEVVEIVVKDRGVFNRRVALPVDETGRGMFVMMALMDEVSVQEGRDPSRGTVVRLRKRRPRHTGGPSHSRAACA